MIQRVLGWVAALGALNPKHADFQKNGWNPVYRAGHALLGFFENGRTDQVAGFKTIRDKNGARRLYCVVRKDTEENRVAIVEGLGSADRVKKLADAVADCCFNFVVMWRFVNQSVGATNRALAKREYVSLDVADEIRDTAVEVLRGVRARVTV